METLERLVSETLREAARTAPPPTGLPTTPQRGPRRNLGALVTAAAALVVVIVSIIVVAEVRQDATVDVGPDRIEVPNPDNLVGFGDVAMPVPSGWSHGDYACGEPQSNTVAVLPPSVTPACLTPRADGVSDIVIDDRHSGFGRRWSGVATEEVTLPDGTPALIGSAPANIEGYTTTVVVVPALDAILVGTSPQPGQLDEVLLATTRTPDDMVAMPELRGLRSRAAELRLEELGLRADLKRVLHSNRGAVVVTDPPAGTVVPVDSVIRVGIGR